MCLGFKIFCCSSALLAFLWHPATFGAAEKEGVTRRRGPLPFNVSDLFYNSNSLVGKKVSLVLVVKHYVCQVNITSQASAGLVQSFAQSFSLPCDSPQFSHLT